MLMKRRFFAVSLTSVLIFSMAAPAFADGGNVPVAEDVNAVVPGGRKAQLRYARELLDHRMYVKARDLFSQYPDDPVAAGYAVLCDVKMRTSGYEAKYEDYIAHYPYSGLVPQLRYAQALNLFDVRNYFGAIMEFNAVKERDLYRDQLAEYTFKKAYSNYEIGNEETALAGFQEVMGLEKNDYQAPSAYTIAYVWYGRENFTKAIPWFEKSAKDSRFAEMSSYYIMECRFMNKDYKYVTDNAEKLYSAVPEERKPHLARIISESYLVQGDAVSAKKYYDRTNVASGGTDKDYFYAGSLMYALQDYKGAIENYTKMTDRSDSLGQLANYQLAYSYIQTKNKVAAMQGFKDASAQSYDAKVQEDAWFNYAKLAFDLNHDPSVFDSYIKKYPEKAKGDRIYSYMALSALYNKDYAGAVEAYDKIDVLDEDMQNNYMKANYLRAEQLISAGSYRSAIPCLKAAAYYSDKRTGFNQLSRYWLAESYYRDDDFTNSADLYKALYNTSALDGRTEGNLLTYDVAYCYFKEKDYENAAKWFNMYLESGDKAQRKDAFTRLGDGHFIGKDYKSAISAYKSAISEDPSLDDLYPYYQAGLSYSLTDNNPAKIALLLPVQNAKPEAAYYCETYYELGRAYVAAGNNDNAMACFKKLAQTARDSSYRAKSLISMGMVATNESQYEEAVGYYKQVVEEMPSTQYYDEALAAIESVYQTKQEPEKYFAYLKTLSGGHDSADQEAMYFNAAEQIFLAENYQKALTSLQAYLNEYPYGKNSVLAKFYVAESYKNLGKKDHACDWYKAVAGSGEDSYVEIASLNYAKLSYGLEHYADAYAGYSKLLETAKIDNNKHTAKVGMMNSAYLGKDYASAIKSAEQVAGDNASDADDVRRARYVEAKSYLATSQRDEAYALFKTLSKETSTPEGAEAAYLVILDSYDQGKFDEVETLTYAFSDSGSDQTYWLAKAFITLGDAFAERGEMKQAKATFESIRDGYSPEGMSDDVLDNVNMRLSKIAEMEEE